MAPDTKSKEISKFLAAQLSEENSSDSESPIPAERKSTWHGQTSTRSVYSDNKILVPDTKVIFLDVDGTIAHLRKGKTGQCSMICMKCVKRLKAILESTNSKLVISSTWRHTPALLESLKRYLKIGKIDETMIIGQTPHLPDFNRTHEIGEWLANPFDWDGEMIAPGSISQWIAMDDINLAEMDTNSLEKIAEHYILLDPQKALCEDQEAEMKAISKLYREDYALSMRRLIPNWTPQFNIRRISDPSLFGGRRHSIKRNSVVPLRCVDDTSVNRRRRSKILRKTRSFQKRRNISMELSKSDLRKMAKKEMIRLESLHSNYTDFDSNTELSRASDVLGGGYRSPSSSTNMETGRRKLNMPIGAVVSPSGSNSKSPIMRLTKNVYVATMPNQITLKACPKLPSIKIPTGKKSELMHPSISTEIIKLSEAASNTPQVIVDNSPLTPTTSKELDAHFDSVKKATSPLNPETSKELDDHFNNLSVSQNSTSTLVPNHHNSLSVVENTTSTLTPNHCNSLSVVRNATSTLAPYHCNSLSVIKNGTSTKCPSDRMSVIRLVACDSKKYSHDLGHPPKKISPTEIYPPNVLERSPDAEFSNPDFYHEAL